MPQDQRDDARYAALVTAGEVICRNAGDDLEGHGLGDTPKRFAKAMAYEWLGGYGRDPENEITVFKAGPENSRHLVFTTFDVTSLCEHHLAPFFGRMCVAYHPNADGRVVGLSKMVRVARIYSQRLQTQERLVTEVATALYESPKLKPRGVGVTMTARHFCIESRGVCHPAETVATFSTGTLHQDVYRREFERLVGATR